MNKILMVATIPGTLNAFLLPFARHFKSQGWQVDAIASGISSDSQCLETFDRVWDVEWSRNPLDPKNLLNVPRKIRQAIACGQYDIIHTHTSVASFVTRYTVNSLPKHTKPKLIYTAHGFNFHPGGKFLKNAVFIGLEKLAGAWTDYLVTINHDDEQAAKRYGLLPTERIHYMPGIGVDLNQYKPSNISLHTVANVRNELGLSASDSLFLAVAEFTPNKRHQDMVRAFAQLNRREAHLVFAGVGDQEVIKEVQKLVSQLGIEKQVHFLGYRRDIAALMRASVATLLTSEREGLPRSVMEALCLEIPVIGTDIRGIRDLVGKDCGLLVPVASPDKLADAMAWILDQPEEARMMGKCGRERMADYDLKHIIKLHEDLYAEALGRKTAYAAAK